MDKTHDLPILTFDPLKDKISDLPIYDRLDSLILFCTSPGYVRTIISIETIVFHLFPGYDISVNDKSELEFEAKMFIDRLVDDGYLMPLEDGYRATLKARIMQETKQGGYRAQIFIQKAQTQSDAFFKDFQKSIHENQNAMMERQNVIQNSTRILTFWVMLGTLSSACLSAISLCQDSDGKGVLLRIDVLTFLTVFVLGIGGGLIIYKTISRQIQ